MTGDWLLFSCIASFIAACALAFILFMNWIAERAGRAAEERAEADRMARYAEHRPCPWELKQ